MFNRNVHLSSITHDLRNYIGGISGLVGIISENINAYLAKQEAKGVKLDENLKEISQCANMLAPYSNEAMHYVEDLLNNAQIQSGKFVLGELEDCDVGELVRELLVFNRRFILDHQIVVQTNIEENLPKLKTDILRFKQILINLITNAVKYSAKGNQVEISVRCLEIESKNWIAVSQQAVPCNDKNKQQIQIIISDSGIGMTKEEIEMALNGYGRNIDKSGLDKPIDSHGLGMPIVQQLVELLGVRMEIESRKGKGTKILLNFLDC